MEFNRRIARHRPVAQRQAVSARRKAELARIKARREELRFQCFHIR
jgi:hypothetical protein